MCCALKMSLCSLCSASAILSKRPRENREIELENREIELENREIELENREIELENRV